MKQFRFSFFLKADASIRSIRTEINKPMATLSFAQHARTSNV